MPPWSVPEDHRAERDSPCAAMLLLALLLALLVGAAGALYLRLRARRDARRYIAQHHTVAQLRVVGAAAPGWAAAESGDTDSFT